MTLRGARSMWQGPTALRKRAARRAGMNAALAPHPMQTLIAGTAGVSPSTKQCRGCMQEEFPTCPVVQSMRVAPSGATRIKRARVPSLIVVMHMQCSKARSRGAYHTCEQWSTLPRSHIQGALLLHQNITCPLGSTAAWSAQQAALEYLTR